MSYCYRKLLLSVEQAVQSALGQVDQALLMLNHVDPSQVKVFRDALTVKFALGAVAMIESAAPAEPEPTQQPDPVPPAPEAVIDVEVTPTEPEQAPEPDIEQELNKLPLPSLRSLAKSKGVDGRGTKANLARRLKMLITNVDLRALA
ncbi:hypothetical protein QUA41_27780 [Microcoleus sp. Pol11C1]|uniref:hypothetical protein n=1 Tax=unclassified Microcoleus TaxID=2642155 RepID=UPI002FD13C66